MADAKQKTPDERAQIAIARRNRAKQWLSTSIWKENEEVYRAYQVKSLPVYKRDQNGKETSEEDLSRTNVCMPTIALMVKKNAARLTANPPKINYRCKNELVAQKLTAWAYMQFDRSGEYREHRRVIEQGELFGYSYSKAYWNTVEVRNNFRKKREDFRDRKAVMDADGAPQEQIDAMTQQYGEDASSWPPLSDQEVSNDIASKGPEVLVNTPTLKYDGPVVKMIFVGKLYFEPGVRRLDDSDWIIEEYEETDLWLEKMLKQTYKDAASGGNVPVFQMDKVKEFLETDPKVQNDKNTDNLLRRLQSVAKIAETTSDDLSRSQGGLVKFDVVEMHERRGDGNLWISWFGNDNHFLGEMPYIWDLNGKWLYTEYVPIPDIISPFGNSTPRQLRYLHQLHNVTVSQRTDLITDILRRTAVVPKGEDVPDEAIERGRFRVIQGKNITPASFLADPDVPASAWESEAQILRMMAMAEPSLNTVDTGSASNPQAGKLATTALLNAKSSDVLVQAKLEQVDLYLREIGQKKLLMLQQEMEDAVEISQQYVDKVNGLQDAVSAQQQPEEGLSERYGKTAVTKLDPYEIQEDIEVEPEAMSMLSVADDLKRQDAIDYWTVANQAPDIFDRRYAGEYLASTMHGIDSSKAIIPANPEPPKPEVKTSVSVSVKYSEMSPQQRDAFMAQYGLPASDTPQLDRATFELSKLNEGANHATNLLSPAQPEESQMQMGNVKESPKDVTA